LQDLGYAIEITNRKQGFFSIAGIGEEVEEQFSKRVAEIDEKIKELRELRYCEMDKKKVEMYISNRSVKELKTLFEKYGKKNKEELTKFFKNCQDKVYVEFSDAQVAVEANLMSRGKKRKDLTMQDLRADVEEQLSKIGTSLEKLYENAKSSPTLEGSRVVKTKGKLATFGNLDEIFEIAMRDITEQQSAFQKEEFLLHCMKLGLGDYSGADIIQKFAEKILKKEILAMPDEAGIFTTQKMVDIEKAVIDNCKEGVGKSQIKVDKEKSLNFIETTDVKLKIGNSFKKNPQELQKIFAECDLSAFSAETKAEILQTFETSDKDKFQEIYNICDVEQKKILKEFISKAGYGFTPGQKDAIELIASTDCQFSVIQGDAGTGKSFSMNFAREMLEADGFIVRGFAPTGKASVELSNSAKIKGLLKRTVLFFICDILRHNV